MKKSCNLIARILTFAVSAMAVWVLLINSTISSIKERLNSVYYNIPVTALRYY
ncbi:MAG: hypothetical protein KIG32_04875 [Ruminiclostridium sp.]|nr:hypothetical protein [Ruminiclostridium sp.]